jgi:hypothetical protein
MERDDSRTAADEETRDELLDRERVTTRADELMTEEKRAGSEDPHAQAAQILEESNEREEQRPSPGSQPVEHRRSEDTVDRT